MKVIQTPDDNPLDSNPLEPFTKLEAFYDSLYEKRTENEAMAKRDFWHWLKMTFEAPGLKARSSVPASVSPIHRGEEQHSLKFSVTQWQQL